MIFFVGTILVQILCVVHLIRNRRANLWLRAPDPPHRQMGRGTMRSMVEG